MYLQITPLPAVLLAIIVLVLVEEPARGSNDVGHASSPKGVQGKSGLVAYFKDVHYCLTKLVITYYTIYLYYHTFSLSLSLSLPLSLSV